MVKAIAIAVYFLACGSFVRAEPGQNEPVSAEVAQSSKTWAWPDYRKDWLKLPQSDPILIKFLNKNPEYKRLKVYSLDIGVRELWLENKENPAILIVECSVLGNDSVTRMWLIATPDDRILPVSFQIKVKDKWVEVEIVEPRFSFKDGEDYLKTGKLSGIWMRINPLDEKAPPVEVWLENKEK